MVLQTTGDRNTDDGFVQKAEVSVTSTIQQNQQLYISVWAENKVSFHVSFVYCMCWSS